MTEQDIVERLRSYAEHPAANHYVPMSPETLREAADEIERLRAAQEEMNAYFENPSVWQQRLEASEAVVEVSRPILRWYGTPAKNPRPITRLAEALAAYDKAMDTETRSTTPDNLNTGGVHDGETTE